jgi:hypothetical protein
MRLHLRVGSQIIDKDRSGFEVANVQAYTTEIFLQGFIVQAPFLTTLSIELLNHKGLN